MKFFLIEKEIMHTVLKIKHYRYVQKQTPHPHLHPQFHSLDFVAFHTWVSVVHSPSLACSPGAGSVIPRKVHSCIFILKWSNSLLEPLSTPFIHLKQWANLSSLIGLSLQELFVTPLLSFFFFFSTPLLTAFLGGAHKDLYFGSTP